MKSANVIFGMLESWKIGKLVIFAKIKLKTNYKCCNVGNFRNFRCSEISEIESDDLKLVIILL